MMVGTTEINIMKLLCYFVKKTELDYFVSVVRAFVSGISTVPGNKSHKPTFLSFTRHEGGFAPYKILQSSNNRRIVDFSVYLYKAGYITSIINLKEKVANFPFESTKAQFILVFCHYKQQPSYFDLL